MIVPAAEQVNQQGKKWSVLQKAPIHACASPYTASDDELVQAALNLAGNGADFILLDCTGYHEKHLKLLKSVVNIPVIVSNQLMSKLASEFI